MTPAERKALAEELAREALVKMVDQAESEDDSERYIRQAIERALDRVTPASRIQAAERAVVEAANAVVLTRDPGTPGWEQRLALVEAVGRLHALKAQAKAEECGRTVSGSRIRLTSTFEAAGMAGSNDHGSVAIDLRCHLPRGHEGEHLGELGAWRWGDST